jgi:capsular polysaccharide biosynthesis protein
MEDLFKSKNILAILIRWKFHLAVIVAATVLLAIFFSSPIFITPLYKSYAIVYPSNIAPYADETETEQMIQIMQSKEIRDSLIEKFDLPHHYGIDKGYKYYTSTMLWEYGQNVKIAKTPYSAVSIEVWDKDPKTACDMVNEMMAQYNNKVRSLHKQKFWEVVLNYRTVMNMKKQELDSLSQVAQELGDKYGLLDFPNQTREVMRAYLGSGSSSSRYHELQRLKKNLEQKGGQRELLSDMMLSTADYYSELKLDHDRAYLDWNRNYTFINLLNKPFPADKKSYPVRWVIVVVSALAVLLLAIIVIGFIERWRKPEEKHDTPAAG